MDELLVALRAIVSLAAVLGLLLWLRHRIKKAQGTSSTPSEAAPRGLPRLAALFPAKSPAGARARRREKINVVTRAGLGGKAQLVVAEFGGIRYILGVTEHGVNVVDTQEAPVEEEPAEGDAQVGLGNEVEGAESGEPALKSVA